jgi:hypothetical protein
MIFCARKEQDMAKNFRIDGGHAEVRERKGPLHDWGAPDWSILDDRRGDLPEFPLDCLPAPVRAWVKRAANGAGVTPAHVAVPALGIASSLIGMARRAQASKSWKVPMTCWSVVVGASGTGKTPGLDVIKHALDWIERTNRTKIGKLRREHETKAEAAKAARAQWKKQVEEAVAAGQAGPQMPEGALDPGQFIEPRPYISDVTIERIGPLLQSRPQGTLLLRDELSALFLNMSRYSGGQDKPFWLEAWNGGSSVIERVSRSLYIKYLLVGVAGGIQPSLLEPSFEGDHDGMYTRFLFAWPPKAAYQPLTDDAEEVDTSIINIIARLDRLAKIEGGNLVPKEIKLSKEARTEFEGLRKWADQSQEAFDGREREWMAKATAHALRLSGTLCLLDWAASGNAELIEDEIVLGKIEDEPTEIGAEHMCAAIRLVQSYFWPHARAALRQIGLSDRHVHTRRVLRWIRACRRPEQDISIEDIRQDALGQKLDAEGVAALLAAMERSGWVRKKETKVGSEGAGRHTDGRLTHYCSHLRKLQKLRKPILMVVPYNLQWGFPQFPQFPPVISKPPTASAASMGPSIASRPRQSRPTSRPVMSAPNATAALRTGKRSRSPWAAISSGCIPSAAAFTSRRRRRPTAALWPTCPTRLRRRPQPSPINSSARPSRFRLRKLREPHQP